MLSVVAAAGVQKISMLPKNTCVPVQTPPSCFNDAIFVEVCSPCQYCTAHRFCLCCSSPVWTCSLSCHPCGLPPLPLQDYAYKLEMLGNQGGFTCVSRNLSTVWLLLPPSLLYELLTTVSMNVHLST